MNLAEYIPRHKGDLDTARSAVAAGYAQLKPVIPEILQWHQDYNWPVAHILSDLYRDADDDIIPHLERVLQSDDWCWKYWVVSDIIPQIGKSAARHFLPELERLSRAPTKDEIANEIDQVARDALKRLYEKLG